MHLKIKILNEKITYKSISTGIETKSTEDGLMQITFYASVFGNVDSYGDVVIKGAFAKTIREDMSRMLLCAQHDMYAVIGKIDSLEEDEKGLKVVATLANEGRGREMGALLKMGALKEFSIGYKTINSEKTVIDGEEVTLLKEVMLYEISVVSRAANDLAVLVSTQVKSEQVYNYIASLFYDELIHLRSIINTQIDNKVINQISNH